MTRLITVTELAQLIASTPGTVYALTSQGRLDGLIVRVGRSLRFDLEKVHAAIEQGGLAPPNGVRARGERR